MADEHGEYEIDGDQVAEPLSADSDGEDADQRGEINETSQREETAVHDEDAEQKAAHGLGSFLSGSSALASHSS